MTGLLWLAAKGVAAGIAVSLLAEMLAAWLEACGCGPRLAAVLTGVFVMTCIVCAAVLLTL